MTSEKRHEAPMLRATGAYNSGALSGFFGGDSATLPEAPGVKSLRWVCSLSRAAHRAENAVQQWSARCAFCSNDAIHFGLPFRPPI